MCIEFWINKGFSEEEAKQKISEIQKTNAKNRKTYEKEDQNTNIEFYIKRNYPNAEEALKERQTTRTLVKFIEKYGEEEGLEKYNKSIEKFKYSSWDSKTQEEKNELTIKRTKHSNFFSSSSIIFFKNLIKNINIPYQIFWKKNERFLTYNKGIFFYDFCIPEINLIIEYNGIKFHPNKEKMTNDEFLNWKQLLSNKSSQEIYEKDELKKQIAIQNNFDIFFVWENDNMETKITELRNEIISRINKKRNIK